MEGRRGKRAEREVRGKKGGVLFSIQPWFFLRGVVGDFSNLSVFSNSLLMSENDVG